MKLVAGLCIVSGFLIMRLHDIQDPRRVAAFDASLQRSSLAAEEISEMERAVLSGGVPLLLQRRFVEKMMRQDGAYFRTLHQPASEAKSVLRIFRVVDLVSNRLTQAFQDNRYNIELRDVRPMVEFYEESHRRIEHSGESCNETIMSDAVHVYEVTAYHCAKTIWRDRQFSFDELHDVAIGYVPPVSYEGLRIRHQKESGFTSEPVTRIGSALPRIASNGTSDRISSRLIVMNSHGFDYALNIVEKVYFSFAVPLPAGDYWMFIPFKESARRVSKTFTAQGISGTGIADAATGDIVGIATSVVLMDSATGSFVSATNTDFWPCQNGCFTLLVFTGAQHLLPLLPESRRLYGVN